MAEFRDTGSFTVEADLLGPLREQWSGARVDDAGTTAVIAEIHARTGVVVDPHTAVGLGAAAACRRDRAVPMISLATAHPAKFPDAVEAAIGTRPALPDRMADLFEREEHLVDPAERPRRAPLLHRPDPGLIREQRPGRVAAAEGATLR